jgi:pyridoxal phosphate enzyme (YggS family)
MGGLSANLQAVRRRVVQACARCGRDAAEVSLLAVSKAFPPERVREAWNAGQTRFGESYVQEALGKIGALGDLPLEWHFIGPIQSNKTRPIAEHFAWVHSVASLKVAERLSAQRPDRLPALNACLQVNLSGEATKGGVTAGEALALAPRVAALPRLRLRGLMCVPAPAAGAAAQRAPFRALRELRDELAAAGLALDTLSMGMSDDLEAAIAEGATIVRVGTAIFGPRPALTEPLGQAG